MPGRRLALIVAIDEYEDAGLQTLRAPAQDAEALAGVLGDPEVGDFEVSTLRNETHWTIGQRVEELLSDARLDDFVVLHFSCHGIKDDAGELYLAAKNTRPSLLATTALEAALVNRLIRRSRSQRVVLLLDCCFGGAFERGMTARATAAVNVADQFQGRDQDLGGGRGRVVITASSAMEFAFEGSDLADSARLTPSIFTGALVEGLNSGAADRDNDGKFSLGEVYDYVFERVRAMSPNQTPSKFEYGVQGDFVLARNPKWVVAPGPLPPTLMELANHPYAHTRLGSVSDLKRLAGGDDLPLAAGARRQLELLVDDDSKLVVAAALDALDSLSMRVSVSSVDLGQIDLGARSPSAEITIDGPPLAAASRVESSAPNVRVRREHRAIRIEVDTSRAGRIAGYVKVAGPAGIVEVPVVAVVGTAPAESPIATAPSGAVDESRADQQGAAKATNPEPSTALAAAATEAKTPELSSSSSAQATIPAANYGSAPAVPGGDDPQNRQTRIGPRPPGRSFADALSRPLALGVAVLVIGTGVFLGLRGGGAAPSSPPAISPGTANPITTSGPAVESDAAGNVVRVAGATPPFGTRLRTGEHVALTFELHYQLVSHEAALLIVSLGMDGPPAVGCEGGSQVIANSAPISRGEADTSVSIVWPVGDDGKGTITSEGFVGPVPSLWLADQSEMIAQFSTSRDNCYPFGPT